jgi:hypothetical protein
VSDARIRSLDRRARDGDREAMARLLIEEARSGRLSRAHGCLTRGSHRWTTAVHPVHALGTVVGWNVCVDCRTSEIDVRERPLDDARSVGRPVTVGYAALHMAAALMEAHAATEDIAFYARTLCGHTIDVRRSDSLRAWADAAEPANCALCLRARPERVREAEAQAPMVHAALRDLAERFVVPAQLVEERLLAERPPSAWVDGRWRHVSPDPLDGLVEDNDEGDDEDWTADHPLELCSCDDNDHADPTYEVCTVCGGST